MRGLQGNETVGSCRLGVPAVKHPPKKPPGVNGVEGVCKLK